MLSVALLGTLVPRAALAGPGLGDSPLAAPAALLGAAIGGAAGFVLALPVALPAGAAEFATQGDTDGTRTMVSRVAEGGAAVGAVVFAAPFMVIDAIFYHGPKALFGDNPNPSEPIETAPPPSVCGGSVNCSGHPPAF